MGRIRIFLGVFVKIIVGPISQRLLLSVSIILAVIFLLNTFCYFAILQWDGKESIIGVISTGGKFAVGSFDFLELEYLYNENLRDKVYDTNDQYFDPGINVFFGRHLFSIPSLALFPKQIYDEVALAGPVIVSTLFVSFLLASLGAGFWLIHKGLKNQIGNDTIPLETALGSSSLGPTRDEPESGHP